MTKNVVFYNFVHFVGKMDFIAEPHPSYYIKKLEFLIIKLSILYKRKLGFSIIK
ncbi:hypothetical protein Hanom_Chr11g01044741 [Helianthus anomalus]